MTRCLTPTISLSLVPPAQAEGESDMGLALNRYIGNSILPALIKYSRYYADADAHSPLLEAALHTVYREGGRGRRRELKLERISYSSFSYACTRSV